MKKEGSEYEFKIDAFSPATIPMNRLAEYMSDLATLMGEHKSVHFVAVRPGSLCLVAEVEYEAEPKVTRHIQDAQSGDNKHEGTKAIRRINQRLADDNGSAKFFGPAKSNLIEFPGVKRFNQPTFGPFNQPGTLDGIVIRVGGEKEMVPVHLEEHGEIHVCSASREMARDIAPHIFGKTIRVDGVGKWRRERDGEWKLESFKIGSFRVLENISLLDSRKRLQAIPTDLSDSEDPAEVVRKIR